jgi:uracil-DNA glycosylase family 4
VSLHLDERQRAMLAEMHIRVWPARSDATAAPSAKDAHTPTAATNASLTAQTQANHPTTTSADTMPQGGARPSDAPSQPSPQPMQSVGAPRPSATTAKATSDSPEGADGTTLQAQREQVADLGWGALQVAVAQCQACALGSTRNQVVWGQGTPEPNHHAGDGAMAPVGVGVAQADWLVVVAAPTAEDQAQGLPMVGDPGRLLDNILRALGLQRDGLGPLGHSVFITPAVKCAPPQERNPQAAELAMCEPHLARQIALLRPKVIVAMGLVAAQSVLRADAERIAGLPLGRLRQQVWQHQGTPVVVTYPSAYLMRTPADKAKAWADWCLARTLALGHAG